MRGYVVVLVFLLIDGIVNSLFTFVCPVVHRSGVWDRGFSNSDPYCSRIGLLQSHFLQPL